MTRSFLLFWIVLSFGCAAGFPPKLVMPPVTKVAPVVKVEGYGRGSGVKTTQLVAVRTESGFKTETVEIDKTLGEFITRLERAHIADYFVMSGQADYTIVGTLNYKGGVHNVSAGMLIAGYCTLGILWLFPWGDAAHANVDVKIYDRDGKIVESFKESDGIVYGNWIIGILTDTDRKRGIQIREAILDRAAVRVVEAIQKDTTRR